MSLTLFPFLQRSFVKIVKRGTAMPCLSLKVLRKPEIQIWI